MQFTHQPVKQFIALFKAGYSPPWDMRDKGDPPLTSVFRGSIRGVKAVRKGSAEPVGEYAAVFVCETPTVSWRLTKPNL